MRSTLTIPIKPKTLRKTLYTAFSKATTILLIALGLTTYVFGQPPVANFTASTTSGCAPLAVAFTDQSTGNPTVWNWEFSDGTLSSVQNPVVTFSNPGTYSVKLVVQNSSGGISQSERINYITVYPSPVVNFSANLTVSCVPTTINFTDQSTTSVGTIIAWDWDFGDGGTSTQQNPSHAYTTPGFYSVSLTVTSSNGCKKNAVTANYIRVVSGISTDFAYTLFSSCTAPFSIDFQNQSSGPGNITYTWNFGNGQTSNAVSPTAVYNASGTYTVTLNAQSNLGCVGSTQKTITIGTVNTDYIAPPNVCLNVPINFQNSSSSPPLSSFWNFGDGTFSGQVNPVKTFTTPGTYSVTLVNQYQHCTDSITKQITVNDQPIANFTANDSTSCQAPFTVQFTDLTVGSTSWQWNFGDGNTSSQQNPSHTYSSFGNYTVTLTITVASGCSGTITKNTYIQVQPINISLNVPEGGCIPFTYTPQAFIQSLEPIVSYQWNLGAPGATFNVQNPPPYTYTATGSYTISLTVATASGCTQTVSVPSGVLTGTPPIVNFSASPLNACASDTISFTNTSTTTPGATISYLWNFGDGSTATAENPLHIFMDTGYLTVTLVVSNNRCRDSIQKVLHVQPPVAIFDYTFDCATRMITLRDSSLVDPGILPISYQWQMGDPANTQFNVRNPPPFLYPGPGTYLVKLTVTNGTCSYTTTKPVIIASEPPDFSINRNPVCKNEVFTLTAINSNAANIASYHWTVGGNLIADSSRSVTYSLPNNGTYDVTLTLTDLHGCITTKTLTNYITVNGPAANFIPSTPGACLNKIVTFTDHSTPAGNIVNWHFNFGDGIQQNFIAPPFSHTYGLMGGYPVTLTVTDAAGCTDNYSLPARLMVTNPYAGFKSDTIYCPNAPLQFSDTSAGVNLSYLWNFVDGAVSNLQNPQHSYPSGNNVYTVKLKVTDASGCMDSITKVNYIKIRSPRAAFTISDTTTLCPPLRTSFTFLGSDYKTFNWDFGDGGQSTLLNPIYFYSNYGTYIPKLYVQGPGGCVDSAQSNVVIHSPAEIQMTYGPATSGCNSLNVDFNVVAPAGYKFKVYFGDGSVDSSGQKTLSHFYSRPSFNYPIIRVFDTISGCQVEIWVGQIDVLGAIPLFGMNKTEFCDTGTVLFTNFTIKNEPITSVVWDFGDGSTSSALNPSHTYNQPGKYVVALNVTTQSNCSSVYRDTILVYRTPLPSILGKDTICVKTNEPYVGTIATPDSLITWQWNFGNGQTSNTQNISITYDTAGPHTIQLIASNKIGCSNPATKTVHVMPPPTVSPVQNPITITVGGGTDLLMNYTGNIVSYLWIPNNQLSCADCAAPFAQPKMNTTYTVQVMDNYGCVARNDITVIVLCGKTNFFIPNTFSPNGDGQNEVFYPRGNGLFRIKSMLVFDRWGEVVFEKKDFLPNDPSAGWTGTFKGRKASADVYIYMMEIICDNNTVIPVKGNVTLLR